jgi:hypothetical protein
MLTIQNIDKIIGEELDCKWLPNTKDWWVRNIEEAGDTYIFELMNTDSNARFGSAEIQLRREPKLDLNRSATVYEMWAWNLENNKPEILWRTKADLETVRDGVLWIGYVLDKIVPSK